MSRFIGGFTLGFLLLGGIILSSIGVHGQTFSYPSGGWYSDTLSLSSILSTVDCDTFRVRDISVTTGSGGSGFRLKSAHAFVGLLVDTRSPDVGAWTSFSYLVTYRTLSRRHATDNHPVLSDLDTLLVTYQRDSLALIQDHRYRAVGSFPDVQVIVCDVVEIKDSAGQLIYRVLAPGPQHPLVPDFVSVYGSVHTQSYVETSSPQSPVMGSVVARDSIATAGVVELDWSSSMGGLHPASYEVEWTYVLPGEDRYDFRHHSTRIFTNSLVYRIPVGQREGHLVYRVRVVRPDPDNWLSRLYGPWSLGDAGTLSSASGHDVSVGRSRHDSLNWDLKISFSHEGSYTQSMTYYDGLLRPRQRQLRQVSRPGQTIISQSLYDYEGRAVIESLPIPVRGKAHFGYEPGFLRPSGGTEYHPLDYDAKVDASLCPVREFPIPPLDAGALANQYYSSMNPHKGGLNDRP